MSLREELKILLNPFFKKYGKQAVLEEVITLLRREELGAAAVRALEHKNIVPPDRRSKDVNPLHKGFQRYTITDVMIKGRKN